MKTSDFDYDLPHDRIAQTPLLNRDESRLMVLSRAQQGINHHRFYDIGDLLRRGDVLVFNDSRVIPARLYGNRVTGGKTEILLLRHLDKGIWESLVKRAKKVSIGDRIQVSGKDGKSTWAEVMEQREDGVVLLRFPDDALLEEMGEVPLPPYIHSSLQDPERYQTVYARVKGSVAAPTAGLHFTPQLLENLRQRGIDLAFVTLHVGMDSFRPVRVEDPRDHQLHQEYGELSEEVAQKLISAKERGGRIISVGTTTLRLLESAALKADNGASLEAFRGWSGLFILPGFQFKVADGLLTNFHLPRSTLLMLVSAFAGKDLVDRAYEEARSLDYRFYSFGDAMLIL